MTQFPEYDQVSLNCDQVSYKCERFPNNSQHFWKAGSPNKIHNTFLLLIHYKFWETKSRFQETGLELWEDLVTFSRNLVTIQETRSHFWETGLHVQETMSHFLFLEFLVISWLKFYILPTC